MDGGGKLRLEYGGVPVGFGSITTYGETFSKSCMTTPLVSLTVDDTFVIENGSSKVYSFKFARVHPENYDDSSSDTTRWSNRKWYEEVVACINRWQARTDGAILSYTPDSDNPYIPARMDSGTSLWAENGYIKTLTLTYSPGENCTIYGSMEFHVGAMFVKTILPDPTTVMPRSEFIVQMSGPESNSAWHLLMGRSNKTEINCIESYELSGGPESPFETLTMVIPKNRLSSVAPDLVDSIIAGKNKLVVNAIGNSMMTVTKCKLKNKKYQITAYCDAERLRGTVLSTNGSMTPFQWIRHIVSSGQYLDNTFAEHTRFIYLFSSKTGNVNTKVKFSKGVSTWYVLQVCAAMLRCKIWFADNKCYLVDLGMTLVDMGTTQNPVQYRSDYEWVSRWVMEGETGTLIREYKPNNVYPKPLQHGLRTSSSAADRDGDIDLYKYGTSSSTYVFAGRVTGSVSLGDEGIDTIINRQVVTYSSKDEEGNAVSETGYVDDTDSISEFGVYASSNTQLKELDSSQAKMFGEGIVYYRAEPQQTISFSLKELEGSRDEINWVPVFPMVFQCDSITSTVDDVTVTNESDIPDRGRVLQKLCMSTYTRHYPEGVTDYTFGLMANIDLSSSTSQILTAQNGQ